MCPFRDLHLTGYFRFLSMHASPQCIYLPALGHLDQMLSGYQVCLLSQGKKEALGGGKWGGE